MPTVAIIGAGDLGGAIAQALAARDRVERLILVDAAAGVAAGKALDIQQMGAIAGFHTRLEASDDMSRVTGCAACILADRVGRTSTEWAGDEAVAMLARLAPSLGDAPIVLAGAAQGDVLLGLVRDAGLPRRRIVGSAPEAFASAVRGIVAVEARCSPQEVALTVLGAPGRFVLPWSEASIGGFALERVLTQVQLTRIDARVPRLWAPGVYTLGLAAARAAEAVLVGSRRAISGLTLLDGEFGGAKNRVAAMPVLLAAHGIAHVRTPTLSPRERVLVQSALGS